jgi:phage terminase large subunit-like protein
MATTARKRAPAQGPRPSVRVDRFFRRHLRHSSGRFAGEPFILDPWQRDEIIAPVFNTIDRRGRRRFREALIGIPRGNGKSPLAAGVALYGLFADNEPGAEVYSLAASKDQAKIVFNTARKMVRASPTLDAMADVYRDAIEVRETGSLYRVLSADANLAHGYNPHIVTIDELHVHKTPDLYEAMSSALHKREQPLIFGITTAGWDRKTLLWWLYQRGLAGGDPAFFFRWWTMADTAKPTDSKAIRAANPASWLRIADIRRQQRSMPLNVWLRLHGNLWTSAEDTWLQMDLWDACSDPAAIPVDAPVYIAVDAAPKKDTMAVVVAHRDEQGVHHWRPYIFKADRAMGYTDYGAVEDLLRELCRTFDVRRILFDPFTMMRSMLQLADEGLPVEECPQNDARMVPASQNLYDVILEHRLRHGGDPELRAQAQAAAARETSRGWRLHKLRSAMPIDAIVAGAMASNVAEQEARLSGESQIYSFSDEDLGDEQPFDLDGDG